MSEQEFEDWWEETKMSDLENKEFKNWWNSQIDSLDYATSLYTDEQFSLEQMKGISQKAWEKSREQVIKILHDGTKEEIELLYKSIATLNQLQD